MSLSGQGDRHLSRHAGELRDVQMSCPRETALGEHLKHGFDAIGIIQASNGHEDRTRKSLKVGGKESRAALRTEVSVKAVSGFGYVMKRLRLAAC